MMEDYLIVFYKWKSHSEQKRIAASMPIKAYNDSCAEIFTGRRILRMYYIFIGFVVWLVCQIIPFLAGFAAMLFWLFIIGFMTSIILGID